MVVGGDVVPSFGGYLAHKSVGEDWREWPTATVGDRIVVIRRTEGFREYDGPPPFHMGGFSAAEKGLPVESYVGQAVITAVSDGVVSTDVAVPSGDVAYLIPNDPWPDDESAIGWYAGRPGMAFARVLTNGDGEQMVPHFVASDVAIDNRLMPQKSWTSTHRFEASCTTPTATARLLYRPYTPDENRLRQWDGRQRIMMEASR